MLKLSTLVCRLYDSLTSGKRFLVADDSINDPRTRDSIFYSCCDEIADVSLLEAMQHL